ncbi:hypothetical protein GQ600_24058 [Phytophthora cactorum]|nr:hypothetical protein GQ600_24058 [Phytophthora cactorum]
MFSTSPSIHLLDKTVKSAVACTRVFDVVAVSGRWPFDACSGPKAMQPAMTSPQHPIHESPASQQANVTWYPKPILHFALQSRSPS